MDDFHNLQPGIASIDKAQSEIVEQINGLKTEEEQDKKELSDLQQRVNSMLKLTGADSEVEFKDALTLEELNSSLTSRMADFKGMSESDRVLGMNPVDYIVAALAGGIAIVVDFVLVKIPKDDKYLGKFEQEGSPLTMLLRKIGNEGKAKEWIGTLEKWFHVNYDPSIREGVFGGKNHRIYSGGHDPSPSGLVFAIKDILSGTFTYFDKSGRLVIEKAEEMGLWQKCLAPIMWFGHIISDLFTSAGVPVPGGTLLRAIQIGEFGKKGRTLGELVEWMYIRGYDMRHLATMSTANGAMNLIIGLYFALISPLEESTSQLVSEREYVEVKNNEKKVKMKLVASSVAVAGNVAKLCAYEGNPNAFNYALWYEMIKQAIAGTTILTKDKAAEHAIENRHVIDENFEILLNNVHQE